MYIYLVQFHQLFMMYFYIWTMKSLTVLPKESLWINVLITQKSNKIVLKAGQNFVKTHLLNSWIPIHF